MADKKLKRLPLGLSTFSELVQENYVYVDKTALIYQMVTGGKYYFISRPRRFGKSLLVSTLAELFAGNKELFKDLWIGKSNYTWPAHPVIRFDFSGIGNRTVQDLITNINVRLDVIAGDHELDVSHFPSIDSKFQALISKLAQQNKVVILIDEYDKPILDHIDNPQEAAAQREVLKSLYSVIKASDQYLRFVLLTGVSKFAKTSIFSGINNLKDITLDQGYATLLGYTKQELLTNFAPHLDLLAVQLNKSQQETIAMLTEYYDGYQFVSHAMEVFNPYSILSCLKKQAFGHYWFATGTPTFLIKLIETGHYPLSSLYQPIMSADELDSFEPDNIKITALLYQTGYLTIKEYQSDTGDYTLDFPNREVTRAFTLLLASSFTQLTHRQTRTYAQLIAHALYQQDMEEVNQQLQQFFNEMPYNAHINREFDLQIIMFSVFKLIGIDVDPEVTTSLGRADLVVSLPTLIYIIELKFNQPANIALAQIQDKKYYEKYLGIGKDITLLGIGFDKPTKIVSLEWNVIKT